MHEPQSITPCILIWLASATSTLTKPSSGKSGAGPSTAKLPTRADAIRDFFFLFCNWASSFVLSSFAFVGERIRRPLSELTYTSNMLSLSLSDGRIVCFLALRFFVGADFFVGDDSNGLNIHAIGATADAVPFFRSAQASVSHLTWSMRRWRPVFVVLARHS